ncbi:MAG: hypothetical protein OHK006_20490 [Thermodesulfovibrionales bacterium]
MGETKYCLCCDEQVPFSIVERNERREFTCVYCGFSIDVQKLWEKPAAQSQPVEQSQPVAQSQPPAQSHALVAEDSSVTRTLLEGLMKLKGFSANVLSFENGLGLISAYSKLLAEKKPVDIAVIDLNMPVMDGLTTARTMRAIEEQNSVPKVPIVFFSAEKADDNLKRQMEALEPANYVNKGSDPDPGKLAARVDALISQLIEKYRTPAN